MDQDQDQKTPLEEFSRRRAFDFREGFPVRLGGGETWNLRMPRPTLGARINPSPYGPQVTLEWSLGPGREEAARIFTDSWLPFYGHCRAWGLPEAASDPGYRTALNLAYLLLYMNYDLSMDEYQCLVSRADPEVVQEVLAFVLGGLGVVWAGAAQHWGALTRPTHPGLAFATGLPRLDPALN